ncbi:hypothetical protein [Trebonia sp.]|uniref:hypothetical protein n=1 Tax=Trebonia sp. TaxID=2767075 RepID=UPI00261476F7|nr:hypothetical protein [Trebonia sp.]
MHEHWPAEFVGLMLPRVLPTLDARLADGITVQIQVTRRNWPPAGAAAAAEGDLSLSAVPHPPSFAG